MQPLNYKKNYNYDNLLPPLISPQHFFYPKLVFIEMEAMKFKP